GHGGEMLPVPDWGSNCLGQLETWSSTTSSAQFVTQGWVNNWLIPMANFEGGANFGGQISPLQLMGAITPMGNDSQCSGCQVPDLITPFYAVNRMGFGSQGLEISD